MILITIPVSPNLRSANSLIEVICYTTLLNIDESIATFTHTFTLAMGGEQIKVEEYDGRTLKVKHFPSQR